VRRNRSLIMLWLVSIASVISGLHCHCGLFAVSLFVSIELFHFFSACLHFAYRNKSFMMLWLVLISRLISGLRCRYNNLYYKKIVLILIRVTVKFFFLYVFACRNRSVMNTPIGFHFQIDLRTALSLLFSVCYEHIR